MTPTPTSQPCRWVGGWVLLAPPTPPPLAPTLPCPPTHHPPERLDQQGLRAAAARASGSLPARHLLSYVLARAQASAWVVCKCVCVWKGGLTPSLARVKLTVSPAPTLPHTHPHTHSHPPNPSHHPPTHCSDSLADFQLPELKRSPLDEMCLQVGGSEQAQAGEQAGGQAGRQAGRQAGGQGGPTRDAAFFLLQPFPCPHLVPTLSPPCHHLATHAFHPPHTPPLPPSSAPSLTPRSSCWSPWATPSPSPSSWARPWSPQCSRPWAGPSRCVCVLDLVCLLCVQQAPWAGPSRCVCAVCGVTGTLLASRAQTPSPALHHAPRPSTHTPPAPRPPCPPCSCWRPLAPSLSGRS